MVTPTADATGLADAIKRCTPPPGSPAIGAAQVLSGVIRDILGTIRSGTAPTMGAIE